MTRLVRLRHSCEQVWSRHPEPTATATTPKGGQNWKWIHFQVSQNSKRALRSESKQGGPFAPLLTFQTSNDSNYTPYKPEANGVWISDGEKRENLGKILVPTRPSPNKVCSATPHCSDGLNMKPEVFGSKIKPVEEFLKFQSL